MSAAAERLLRRIEAIDTASAENRQRAEAYAAMGEELKKVTAEVTVEGGSITVVAAPGGVITDIRFTEAVSSVRAQQLARQVQRAVAQAQTEVARKQAEVVRDGLGDTELLDRVIESDRQLFGTQEPETPPEPARRRRPEPEEEESFEDFSIFDHGR